MKLKKSLKGVGDLRRPHKIPLAPNAPAEIRREVMAVEKRIETYEDKKAQASVSPVAAFQVGMGYTGDQMPDKGLRDGSCNRTACQLPLAGNQQFWMKDYMTGGRLYYCQACERKFTEADRQFREPMRCSPDEDNDNRPRWPDYA